METIKTLKEMAQAKGKQLFIESFPILVNQSQIELLDSKNSGSINLVESFQGEKFKAVAVVRSVPVTRFVENLNGRIYSKELWENVYKAKVAEGTLCLADHPSDDSDGSVKDIVGVWRNFKVGESTCTADLYLVGKHGKHFLEVLQAGGKNGLSTVGFGELMEDEKHVNPRTYELIRLSDWVLTPSQGVYAETDNIDEASISLTESSIKKQNNTNLIEEKRNHKMDNLTGLTIRNNVKVALRESQKALETKSSSLVEAKADLQDVLAYIPEEFKEDRQKLINQIELVEKTIKETIADKTTKLKESQESISNITTKYKTSSIMLAKMKEKLDKSAEVLKLVSENEKVLKSEKEALVDDHKKMQEDINTLLEDYGNMSEDFKHLVSERKTLLSDIKNLVEDKINIIKDLSAFKKENHKLKKAYAKLKEEYDEISSAAYPDSQDVMDDAFADEDYGTEIDDMLAYGSEDPNMGVPFDNYNDEDGFLENKKSKSNIAQKQVRKESVKKVNPDVLAFYKEKVAKKPALKKIQERVLAQPSIVRAVKVVEEFLESASDAPIKLKEAIATRSQNSWINE